jgi:hypothetical protein
VLTVDTIDWAEPIVDGAAKTFTTVGNPPVVESHSVSNLTPTDATLEATINPEELETSYDFHLEEHHACEEQFPPCEMPLIEIPLPEVQLPASSVGQHVSLDLNSAGVKLIPKHQYAYWVSASNPAGSVNGAAQEFTAPNLPAEESRGGEPARPEPTPPLPPPPSSGGQVQSPTKATHCRHIPHRHHAKHHRHRRAGIGKACSSA